MFSIQIGEEFPLFPGSFEKLKGRDGAFFEIVEFIGGNEEKTFEYYFCIHFSDIQPEELHSFRNNKISMRILQGIDGLVLPMIQFGEGETILEMSLNPAIYDDERALQFVDKSNLLTIFIIESNTGVLKALRLCNLPSKMIQICKQAWSMALLDSKYTQKHQEWNQKLSQYPLEILWERATKAGELGEIYDLSEISVPNQYKPQNFPE